MHNKAMPPPVRPSFSAPPAASALAASVAIGIGLIQLLPQMPSAALLWTCAALALALLAFVLIARRRLPAALRYGLLCALVIVAGGVYGGLRIDHQLAQQLPPLAPRATVCIEGVVRDLPQRRADGSVRFLFANARFCQPDGGRALPPLLRLNAWPRHYRTTSQHAPEIALPALRSGQRWRLQVRLRPAHGRQNPGLWSYERWLFEQGIRATGTVRIQGDNVLLTEAANDLHSRLDRIRAQISARFARALQDEHGQALPYGGILTALAIGDRQAITPAQWTVFRHTGVTHLVSISGLHVSLAAFFGALLVGGLWRWLPRAALYLPTLHAATVAGWLSALAYAALSGLHVPALRALLMLTVVAAAVLSGRTHSPARILLWAATAVLLWQPRALLAPGFWLSFGAVAVILCIVSARLPAFSNVRAMVRIQLAISLVSLPALLHFFALYPLYSLVANAFAIVMVSFLITPLALLNILLPLDVLLLAAWQLCAWMMFLLEAIAQWPLATWQPTQAPLALVVCALAGVFWALLPRATPARGVALLACLPLLLWQPTRPPTGEARLLVFDVGQGLAVHIQTQHHDVLYDSGPRYGRDADAGESILVPYLRARGIDTLSMLILSHSDNDHSGGAASVLKQIKARRILASFERHDALVPNAPLQPCQAGQQWQYDGVRFQFLHPQQAFAPDDGSRDHDNHHSCVLRIESAHGNSVLLTGDIERRAERQLLQRHRDSLASDVVLIPHHGSAASSSAAFVRASGARHAIAAAGFQNHFGHPAAAVLRRWQQAGAQPWRTDLDGAIHLHLSGKGLQIEAERSKNRRYWLDWQE